MCKFNNLLLSYLQLLSYILKYFNKQWKLHIGTVRNIYPFFCLYSNTTFKFRSLYIVNVSFSAVADDKIKNIITTICFTFVYTDSVLTVNQIKLASVIHEHTIYRIYERIQHIFYIHYNSSNFLNISSASSNQFTIITDIILLHVK